MSGMQRLSNKDAVHCGLDNQCVTGQQLVSPHTVGMPAVAVIDIGPLRVAPLAVYPYLCLNVDMIARKRVRNDNPSVGADGGRTGGCPTWIENNGFRATGGFPKQISRTVCLAIGSRQGR